MATITSTDPGPPVETRTPTLADIVEMLGVPADRVLARPAPGTATEEDLLAVNDHEDRICELVHGVLVEKAMGAHESNLACVLIFLLKTFLAQHRLGIVLGPDGMLKLAPALVRVPDVSFISRDQLPPGRVHLAPIPSLSPTLAVEVLSKSNTKTEMADKLLEYFAAGSKLVWYLDPADRSVLVYTGPDQFKRLDESETLDGGDVLPGFRLAVQDWFEMAENPFGEA